MKILNEIEIYKITDGNNIFKIAQKSGLSDLNLWNDAKKVELLVQENFWIVYGARIKNLNSYLEDPISTTIGIIAGGIEDEGRLWIEILAVSPEYRKKGIGTQLLDSLLLYCKKNKIRAIFVDVDSDNYGARDYYRKNRFQKAGRIKKYYYDSSNAIIYFKEIKC